MTKTFLSPIFLSNIFLALGGMAELALSGAVRDGQRAMNQNGCQP
jgi:hypothetical protein